MESNISEMIRNSLDNIKEIAGVDTVIGEPIITPSGVSIIPVSKVTVGFATGGLDYDKNKSADEEDGKSPKKPDRKSTGFGGGGGTGVSITPIGFLVVTADGQVNMLNVGGPDSPNSNIVDSLTALLEKSPFIVSKLKDIFNKKDAATAPSGEADPAADDLK